MQYYKNCTKYVPCMGVYRIMAWCKLEFYPLGHDIIRTYHAWTFLYRKISCPHTCTQAHLFMLLIPLTWVVFALRDIGDIGVYFSRLFPFGGSPDFVTTKDFWKAIGDYWQLLIACVFFCLPVTEKIYNRFKDNIIIKIILIIVFVFSMIIISKSTNNPFMYSRFWWQEEFLWILYFQW